MRCPTHLCVGQEKPSGILSEFMKQTDYAISSHRVHGHYLVKGGNLQDLISEIYGKENGCSGGYGGSMHLYSKKTYVICLHTAIVANSIPLGVGLGLSIKLEKKSNISFIFFGDAAIEEGVFYESANFAVIHTNYLYICM